MLKTLRITSLATTMILGWSTYCVTRCAMPTMNTIKKTFQSVLLVLMLCFFFENVSAQTCTPSVSLSSNQGTAVCSGTNVTFTAVPTNGGSAPSYIWFVNNTYVSGPVSTSTYTINNMTSTTSVRCQLGSTASCASPSSAVSNTVTVTINPNVTPSVSISVNPTGTVCSNSSITFTATPTNGGSSPVYQWMVGGAVVTGVTGSTFTASGFSSGALVKCQRFFKWRTGKV
jgi:hypothetical protein